MTISIPPELDSLVRRQAQARGLTVEQYIGYLIREDSICEEVQPLDESDPEFDEIRSAVSEGLRQAERGESRPAEDVLAELRSKLGLSR
jgi:predicted transcriptional regulator